MRARPCQGCWSSMIPGVGGGRAGEALRSSHPWKGAASVDSGSAARTACPAPLQTSCCLSLPLPAQTGTLAASSLVRTVGASYTRRQRPGRTPGNPIKVVLLLHWAARWSAALRATRLLLLLPGWGAQKAPKLFLLPPAPAGMTRSTLKRTVLDSGLQQREAGRGDAVWEAGRQSRTGGRRRRKRAH